MPLSPSTMIALSSDIDAPTKAIRASPFLSAMWRTHSDLARVLPKLRPAQIS
jgi:hypothetical protein